MAGFVSLLVLFILLCPLVGAILSGVLRGGRSGFIATSASAFALLGTSGLFFTAAQGERVVLWAWFQFPELQVDWAFYIDTLTITMLLVITGVGTLIHLYSIGYMKADPRRHIFFVYLNLFLFFMLILVMADNLLVLFVGWEGVGLCSFLLIGFWFDADEGKGILNSRAAVKAFLVNRIGDFGFIVAMLLLAREFQTLRITTLLQLATERWTVGEPLAVGVALLLLWGVTAKSAQLPLYLWLPDAMAGPTPASALIHAATMVTAGIYLIVRTHPLFELAPDVMTLMVGMGLATALLGGFVAINQNDIKRTLAYSTLSQLGLMLTAVGLRAYSAAMFHLVTHAFFKALLFLAAGAILHSLTDTQDIRKMGGLGKRLPTTRILYGIGAVGLMGLPPFAGFFSKDEILVAAWHTEPLLIIPFLFVTILTAFYMTRQLVLIFGGVGRWAGVHSAHEVGGVMRWAMVGLAVLTISDGLLNLPQHHALADWLSPPLPVETVDFQVWLALLSIGLTCLSIALAYHRYHLAQTFKPALPASAWTADNIALRLIVRPFQRGAQTWVNFDDAGFQAAELGLITSLKQGSGWVRRSQTGQLNWNIFGIITTFLILLVIVVGRGLVS